MDFRHPGYAFIESYEEGLPSSRKGLARCTHAYVRFLRREAGLEVTYPIDLERIYHAFQIKQRPLEEQEVLADMQGVAAEELGLVFISDDDPKTRQRFTQAHELIEYLIKALRGNVYNHVLRAYIEGSKKEQLCNWGASLLLMPRSTFVPELKELGMSLATGSELARRYETSLLATLRCMVECHAPQDTALIVWRLGHRKEEQDRIAAANQASLFGDGYRATVSKALRVWWTAFPKHLRYEASTLLNASVPEGSIVAQVFEEGEAQEGTEQVDLVKLKGKCSIEASPAMVGEERCVVSLFRLPPAYLVEQTQHEISYDDAHAGKPE